MPRRLISPGSSFERDISYSPSIAWRRLGFMPVRAGFDHTAMIEAGLADPRMKIEIEVDALIGSA